MGPSSVFLREQLQTVAGRYSCSFSWYGHEFRSQVTPIAPSTIAHIKKKKDSYDAMLKQSTPVYLSRGPRSSMNCCWLLKSQPLISFSWNLVKTHSAGDLEGKALSPCPRAGFWAECCIGGSLFTPVSGGDCGPLQKGLKRLPMVHYRGAVG